MWGALLSSSEVWGYSGVAAGRGNMLQLCGPGMRQLASPAWTTSSLRAAAWVPPSHVKAMLVISAAPGFFSHSPAAAQASQLVSLSSQGPVGPPACTHADFVRDNWQLIWLLVGTKPHG